MNFKSIYVYGRFQWISLVGYYYLIEINKEKKTTHHWKEQENNATQVHYRRHKKYNWIVGINDVKRNEPTEIIVVALCWYLLYLKLVMMTEIQFVYLYNIKFVKSTSRIRILRRSILLVALQKENLFGNINGYFEYEAQKN